MEYDVIVIGGGPGGLAAAYALSDTKRVMVVENNLWGGTCPNFGCDPKKMLYSAVEARAYAGRMTKAGLVGIPDVNWPSLMAFKRGYTETVPSGTKAGLKQAGIAAVEGSPKFVDANTISVAGTRYQATNFIIATGQFPVRPDIPGADLLGTSTDFLDLDELPQTVAFIGAGYVSLELANIAAAAGATVHIINHSARALRAFPAKAVAELRRQMEQERIIFHDNVSLTQVTGSATSVTLAAPDFSLTVQRAFTAAGRAPSLDLNLVAAGVDSTPHGITVGSFMQTSAPNIFAVGDVVAKTQPKLTPVASFEGRYVAEHLLGDSRPIRYPVQPTIVYGATQVAEVGIHLADAEKDPAHYEIKHNDVTHWYTYNRIQEKQADVTVIIDKNNGEIAGAVVVATVADELINYITMLMNSHTKPSAATREIYAYPSVASDFSYLL